jgi:hypothetical protein
MAFKPTSVRPQGNITVLFKGLLVLTTAEVDERSNGCCEVGVHRMTDDHFLIVEIRGKSNGKSFLVMRYAGPLVSQDLTLKLDPPTKTGVLAFHSTSAKFDRSKDNDKTDFRWNIDLNDRDYFHRYDLSMFPEALEPCIKLFDGTFFSHELYEDSHLKSTPPGGAQSKDLYKMAAVIGAKIEVDSRHCLKIEWSGAGSPLVLPRTIDEPATEYLISVRNEPLALDTPPDLNELVNYYPALRKKNDGTVIPPGERFGLTTKSIPTKTDEIPCMPIVLGP